MITVTILLRRDCPACDQAVADLNALQPIVPHRLVEIDVDKDPVLRAAYQNQAVPVVQMGPYSLRPPFTHQDLQVALSAAAARGQQLQETGDAGYRERMLRGQIITRADRFSYWLSQHYMVLFNLAIFLYVGLPFLAPVFMRAGMDGAANVVYTMYKPLCHQLGYRSFFLFGEQAYYPRALAAIPGVQTFQQATGLSEGGSDADTIAARNFKGDEHVGYKIALCERDVALWGGILLFGLLFSLTGKRLPPVPWYIWVIFGLVPIGLDGGSQFLGALPFIPDSMVRESTPLLRVITGALFGVLTAWYLYPLVEENMRDLREVMARKFATAPAKQKEKE